MRSGPLYGSQLPRVPIGPLRMRRQLIGEKFLLSLSQPTPQIFVVQRYCDSSCFHITNKETRTAARCRPTKCGEW